MPRTIRFHLDENCDPRIAVALREHGIDATTARETGLRRAPDEQHFAFAIAEGRVIVTHDTDFLRIAAVQQEHPGIVFFPPHRSGLGHIIRMLTLAWNILEVEEIRGRVEYY